MPCRPRRPAAVWLACGLALLACASDGRGGERNEGERPEAARNGPYLLDAETREATRRVGSDTVDPQAIRFVEVEISEVRNPNRIRLSFEVRYREEGAEEVLLGTFGLFPPDEPGTFLVATRGLLRAGGTIALSMQILDDVKSDDPVEVRAERITLRRE